MAEIILQMKNMTKEFSIGEKKLIACNDISLKIEKGKILGIVGESGCGKTTLVRTIMHLEKINSGEILYKGKNISNFSKEKIRKNRENIQMVFQDCMSAFSSKMQIIDILTEPLLNFGRILKKDKEKKAIELLKMVSLNKEHLYKYPSELSGGQIQRVGIARAISLDPEILVCDETTSALDVSIQNEIIQLLKKLQKEKELTIIFICHDLTLVQSIADKMVVMYLGNIVETINGKDLKKEVKHPYTKALLNSIFSIDFDRKIQILEGEVPSPIDAPMGCPFVDRCIIKKDECKEKKPKLKDVNTYHRVSCHLT